jgi:hypothetical protein
MVANQASIVLHYGSIDEGGSAMLGLAATPEELLDEDVQAVRGAAQLLRIPEFAFFHLAYRRWHGTAAEDREIEPHFARYLFARRAPVWVRHLAREIAARRAEGAVGPETYGVEPILPPPIPSWRHRHLFLALFYLASFVLITICAL